MSDSEVIDFMKTYRKEEEKFKFKFGEFYLQPQAKEKLEIVFKDLGSYKNIARNWNDTVCNLLSDKRDLNDDWAQRDFSQAEFNWKKKLKEKGYKHKTVEDVIKLNNLFINSTAIPGGSQHHLGLAVDVNNKTSNSDDKRCNKNDKRTKEYCRGCDDNCVKKLNENGWFRTIRYDEFHFTYLGWTKPEELMSQGLIEVKCGNYKYWVPNIKRGC